MFTFKLEKFEGPIELLLELIEKEKLDISDISLAKVTDQFLVYTNQLQEVDPNYLANFLVVAAKLILIKSKTLLPSFEVTEEEEQDINDLKEKLIAYQKIKERARLLGQLEKKCSAFYERPSGFRDIRVFVMPSDMTVDSLYLNYKKVQDAYDLQTKFVLETQNLKPMISFEEKMKDLKSRFENSIKESFHKIVDKDSKIHVILTFLAVLELIKQRFLTVEQEDLFGEIEVVKI